MTSPSETLGVGVGAGRQPPLLVPKSSGQLATLLTLRRLSSETVETGAQCLYCVTAGRCAFDYTIILETRVMTFTFGRICDGFQYESHASKLVRLGASYQP